MNQADTPIDMAHGAMEAAPEDELARLRFYDRLAGAEVFLLLDAEAKGERISPRVMELDTGPLVLAFDTEARLTAFAEGVAPYAALSGRALAAMLRGQGVSLGLNLGVAPSAIVLPPDALDWLAGMVEDAADAVSARVVEVAPPGQLPEALITALDAKLPTAEGLAGGAYLVSATYEDGRKGHLLAFADTRPGAEDALAQAAAEALRFSGVEAGEMDVICLPPGDPMEPRLARHGLRFDLPEPAASVVRAAPGSDPDSPPRLR